jgi:predicted RNA-binding protein with PIN domain
LGFGAEVVTRPDVAARRLRPAIEIAFRVARAGEDADPVEPAPAALRRYLSFSRLPAPALEVARRVIDDDAEFRQRVADGTTAEEAGEAGWLWLTRPPGWEDRLDEMVGLAERRRQDASAARDERSLLRRIRELEEALRRLEASAATDREATVAVRAELDAERSRRRDAGRRADEAEVARAAALADVARLSTEVDRLAGDVDRARGRVAELERELSERDARSSVAGSGSAAAAASASASASASAGEADVALAGPVGVASPGVDRDALSRALETASAALAEATALLSSTAAGGAPQRTPTAAVTEPPTDALPGSAKRASTATRHAVRLPGGVLDDGAEAAEYLVRVPDIVLLVDGYNISNALAPGQPLRDQRSRLVDALSELHARTGTTVEVVFDGAAAPDPWISGGRLSVHVQFSPAGVEADDVLVDLIASLPTTRPVILATSDRALRDRARRLGANLLGARQLLAVMRR